MFRKHIELIESHTDPLLTHHIAELVSQGDHEGFNPYWKLIADERVLSDEDAMQHISQHIADGFTSGMHPHWELKTMDAGTPDTAVEDEIADMEGELDEATTDVVHAHMVVPVAQKHGEGEGWYEVSDADAEAWVVEDEHGQPVDHRPSRAEAQELADQLNSGMAPTDMASYAAPEHELVEDDLDPMDDASLGDPMADDTSTMFDNSENYVLYINAIHERGHRQDEALRELDKRGLWLTPEQKEQAGLA